MNKAELVESISKSLGGKLSKKDIGAVVDSLTHTVQETVKAGESVSLVGFGTFEGKKREARIARNPRTGASVDVPAKVSPRFTPGSAFKSAVNC